MTVSSKPLLIRTDCPIDPLTLQIIRLIDSILHGAGIPYMLVGATARDLLLHHVYGLPVTRATYDVDFAILVDSWEQFATVKQLFLKVPGFIDKGRDKQRLFYQRAPAAPETNIDIIPFGKLEGGDRTIAWPPDAEVVSPIRGRDSRIGTCRFRYCAGGSVPSRQRCAPNN
jgi:predicted nucleotidyltransferase